MFLTLQRGMARDKEAFCSYFSKLIRGGGGNTLGEGSDYQRHMDDSSLLSTRGDEPDIL
jgi:hypothetical protein